MLRAVVGARVSVVKGTEKVSHIVQKEAGSREAERNGWPVVGYFEDLDVSATISPFERPDLGTWLNERVDDWDVMIFSKVDRVFRSAKDCADTAHWAETQKKVLVFSGDGITLNFRDEFKDSMAAMMSKVFVMLASLFAEMELRRIRDRVSDAHKYLRTTERWAGGYAPYGYEIVDHPEGGKTLGLELHTAGIAIQMAEWYISGWSFHEIASELNSRGEPTNLVRTLLAQNKTETSKGKDLDAIEWSASVIAALLRSPAMRGYKLHKGKPVRGADGLPIRIAEPVFDDELWARLEPVLVARSRKKNRAYSDSGLLHLLFCSRCKGKLYIKRSSPRNGKFYTYYHCPHGSTKGRKNCGTSQRAEVIERLLEETFLMEVGDNRVPIRRYIPAEDHTAELEQVKSAIKGLREEKDEGLIVGSADNAEWKERMRSLLARRSRLEELPHRPASWVFEDSDVTYRQEWITRDEAGRRRLMLDSGIKLWIGPGKALNARLEIPSDVAEDLRKQVAIRTV